MVTLFSYVLGQICSWKLRAQAQCEVTQHDECLAVRLGQFWTLGFLSKLILSPGICLQFTSQSAQQLHMFSSSAFYHENIQKLLSRHSVGEELCRGCSWFHHSAEPALDAQDLQETCCFLQCWLAHQVPRTVPFSGGSYRAAQLHF